MSPAVNTYSYTRVTKDTIETPIISLTNGKTNIKLFGTIHIGSQKYYDDLFSALNQNDLVLYEAYKKRANEMTIRNKMLLINGSSTAELIQNLIKGINNSLEYKVADVFRDIAKSHPNVDYTKNQAARLDSMKLTKQGSAINRNNLPSSWENADISVQEMQQIVPVFSRRNIDDLKMFILNFILKRSDKHFQRFMETFYSNLDDLGSKQESSLNMLACHRELKVINKLHNGVDGRNIGIAYGCDHLCSLEEKLGKDLGYRRTGGVQWLEAIRKFPLDREGLERHLKLFVPDGKPTKA